MLVAGGLFFSQISAGSFYRLGLDSTSGQLYAWGLNSSGSLGVGDIATRSSPVAVLGGIPFTKVFAAGWSSSTYGITASGQLYGWGVNTSGQLGLGDVANRSSPVAVVGGLTFSNLFVGLFCTFGVTSSGALYAWGANTGGQLGVGDIVSRSSPVAVLGGLTFSQVTTQGSVNSVLGLTTAGVAYGWGNNSFFELGVGNNVARSSPVAVLGGLTFRNLVLSFGQDSGLNVTEASSLGLTTAGQIYSWGQNGNGQLGCQVV